MALVDEQRQALGVQAPAIRKVRISADASVRVELTLAVAGEPDLAARRVQVGEEEDQPRAEVSLHAVDHDLAADVDDLHEAQGLVVHWLVGAFVHRDAGQEVLHRFLRGNALVVRRAELVLAHVGVHHGLVFADGLDEHHAHVRFPAARQDHLAPGSLGVGRVVQGHLAPFGQPSEDVIEGVARDALAELTGLGIVRIEERGRLFGSR